jgi:RimJ/RimL family protein N-acetyltransferase
LGITYRKLLPDDAKSYREIRLESLRSHPESFDSNYDQQRNLPKLRLEKEIEQPSGDIFVMGAFDDDALIGICGFIPFGLPDSLGVSNAGTLIQMYVRSTYSGRKIGLNLVKATIETACKLAQVEQIFLGVKQGNPKAIRVYEQAGFQLYEPEPTRDGGWIMFIHCDDYGATIF